MLATPFGNSLLTYILRGSYATFLSLHTAAPEADDSNDHEVPAANNYSRQPLSGNWTVPAAMSSQQSVLVVFPTAGGSWGTITHVGIMDAETGGSLMMFGELASPKTISTGETIQFSIGNLSVEVTA